MDDIYSARTDILKSQLDFQRKCTSLTPQDRCWLITDLTAWNRVLYRLNYELTETTPGKLSIQHVTYNEASERCENVAPEAAFVISWLVENHRCIDKLRISCPVWPCTDIPEHTPVPVRLRPPQGKGIRCLDLQMCPAYLPSTSSYCYLPEEDMEALQGIEKLKVHCCDARLEAGLVKLLRNNSKSLKFVKLIQLKISEGMTDALLHLDNCESLTVFECHQHVTTSRDTQPATRLIQTMARVQKFFCHPARGSAWNIIGISDLLKTNATVQVLHVYCEIINRSCGDALASALRKNSCLLDLRLEAYATVGCLERIADALSQNTVLEQLQFLSNDVDVQGAAVLCDALRTNTTLKKVVLTLNRASQMERRALAEKLTHGDGYSRVQLAPLEDCDMPPLSRVLTCPTLGPEELSLFEICTISDVNLKLLLDALASNVRVRKLNVDIDASALARRGVLFGMLRVNRSLKSINIRMSRDRERFVPELLDALDENESISELVIEIREPDADTAPALAHFFARNRRITVSRILAFGWDSDPFVEEVFRGVIMNPVIVKFNTWASEPRTYSILETLRRNRSTLNRAVDFVVLHAKDKKCAGAFETFAGRPCLLDKVMDTSGRTESEALQAIAAAGNFLRDNYFVITGVVRHSVSCHPAYGSTQCDALNTECWHAIVRHLKVSDVVG